MGNRSGLVQAQTERRRLVFALQNPSYSTGKGEEALRLQRRPRVECQGWTQSHPFIVMIYISLGHFIHICK